MIIIAAKPDKRTRTSSDSAWPLRNSQGLTFAEAKDLRDKDTADD